MSKAETVAACADIVRETITARRHPGTSMSWAVAMVDFVVEQFYKLPDNEVGGYLHISLDDSNLEDHSIQWCIDNATGGGDAAAVAVGRMLLALTYEERVSCEFVCECCRPDLQGGPCAS